MRARERASRPVKTTGHTTVAAEAHEPLRHIDCRLDSPGLRRGAAEQRASTAEHSTAATAKCRVSSRERRRGAAPADGRRAAGLGAAAERSAPQSIPGAAAILQRRRECAEAAELLSGGMSGQKHSYPTHSPAPFTRPHPRLSTLVVTLVVYPRLIRRLLGPGKYIRRMPTRASSASNSQNARSSPA